MKKKNEKVTINFRVESSIRDIMNEQRGEITQVQYCTSLILLDKKHDLLSRFGDPADEKFPDDDFLQYAALVEKIKPIFDSLINAEQLQEKVDTILEYLNPPTAEAPPEVTADGVAPLGAVVTEGTVDSVQAAAIALAGKAVHVPANPRGLLPRNVLDPGVNKHALYAEIGLGQSNIDKMRANEVTEARQEIAERKKILENLGIGGNSEG